mmetsp:Transcript_49580/g.117669  ORF Transcript_49580/g.117669 Transcript_49580/m.117669 type:complete len:251 (+) Transcript_49580:129-881(+)
MRAPPLIPPRRTRSAHLHKQQDRLPPRAFLRLQPPPQIMIIYAVKSAPLRSRGETLLNSPLARAHSVNSRLGGEVFPALAQPTPVGPVAGAVAELLVQQRLEALTHALRELLCRLPLPHPHTRPDCPRHLDRQGEGDEPRQDPGCKRNLPHGGADEGRHGAHHVPVHHVQPQGAPGLVDRVHAHLLAVQVEGGQDSEPRPHRHCHVRKPDLAPPVIRLPREPVRVLAVGRAVQHRLLHSPRNAGCSVALP